MLYEKIVVLRKKLDDSIKNNCNYEEIYNLSSELDNSIIEYYLKRA